MRAAPAARSPCDAVGPAVDEGKGRRGRRPLQGWCGDTGSAVIPRPGGGWRNVIRQAIDQPRVVEDAVPYRAGEATRGLRSSHARAGVGGTRWGWQKP